MLQPATDASVLYMCYEAHLPPYGVIAVSQISDISLPPHHTTLPDFHKQTSVRSQGKMPDLSW